MRTNSEPKLYESIVESVVAYQWFSVSDYEEGKQRDVGYFRHPQIEGDAPCNQKPSCRHIMHDHGWIDTGGDGITVCPGMWVLKWANGTYGVMNDALFFSRYQNLAPKPDSVSNQLLKWFEDSGFEKFLRQVATAIQKKDDALVARHMDDLLRVVRGFSFKVEALEKFPEQLKAYLDFCIQSWRHAQASSDEEVIPSCYIDAFQSVRVSLFGELLEKSDGGDTSSPLTGNPSPDEMEYYLLDEAAHGFVTTDEMASAGILSNHPERDLLYAQAAAYRHLVLKSRSVLSRTRDFDGSKNEKWE